MLEDGLDREIREHGAGELAQDIRQLPLACHDPPGSGRGPLGLGGERLKPTTLRDAPTTGRRQLLRWAKWSESPIVGLTSGRGSPGRPRPPEPTLWHLHAVRA